MKGSLIQIVIAVDTGTDDPKAVLARVLDQLPGGNDFSDVSQSIDGIWVDEEGDRA